jgi:hypothetical protein
MRKADVSLGHIYIAKVSGKLTRVRLDRESPFGNGWIATNLVTNREVRVRSAARLRKEVTDVIPKYGVRN